MLSAIINETNARDGVSRANRPFSRAGASMDGSARLETLSVLVVDDEMTVRNLVFQMCRRMSIGTVVDARSGAEALKLIETTTPPFSLVICDWNMPGMSGMELFQNVRPTWPNLPFLMLTGRTDANSVLAAKKSGVEGYLVKPFSANDLQAKILSLVGKSSQGAGPMKKVG